MQEALLSHKVSPNGRELLRNHPHVPLPSATALAGLMKSILLRQVVDIAPIEYQVCRPVSMTTYAFNYAEALANGGLQKIFSKQQ